MLLLSKKKKQQQLYDTENTKVNKLNNEKFDILVTFTLCHFIEPKKSSRPRIKFFGASSDEESDGDQVQEDRKQSAVKFADKPMKPRRKAMFADEPKVSHLHAWF